MVESIQALPQCPHAIVITGDLVESGKREEYANLRDLLAPLPMPVYLMAGNHDDRQNLRAIFHDHDYLHGSEFVQYRVQLGAVHLVALDTSEPGQSAGVLCEQRLAWLNAQLKEVNDAPVVIAMHHPPFRTLIRHMDDIGLLRGAKALDALLRRHPNVERVICGHLHRAIEAKFGGTLASVSPAPAHQITLDLDPQAHATWMLEPPAFRIHAWDDIEQRLVTHLMPCGEFGGPYPF